MSLAGASLVASSPAEASPDTSTIASFDAVRWLEVHDPPATPRLAHRTRKHAPSARIIGLSRAVKSGSRPFGGSQKRGCDAFSRAKRAPRSLPYLVLVHLRGLFGAGPNGAVSVRGSIFELKTYNASP